MLLFKKKTSNKMKITRASSITHEHLLAIINTECYRFQNGPLRILDAGCGNGKLIAYLQENLPLLRPAIKFEIHGYDVCDSGVQISGYFADTLNFLFDKFNDINWLDRVKIISAAEPLPYQKDFFNIIVSNQVMEHINDHDIFFSQIKRMLCPKGFSVHLFPLKHCIFEGHLNLPFAHRILSHDILFSYIKLFSMVGFGKYKLHKKTTKQSVDTYAERHADYMIYLTNYISYKEALFLGKKHGLRTSFKYTNEFYKQKIRSILHFNQKHSYKRVRSVIVEMLSVLLFKYISSITLFLENEETYTNTQ